VSDVEKHLRYATETPTVPDAFAFVMQHLDEFAEPAIEIRPRRFTEAHWHPGEPWALKFEVTVGGLVPNETPPAIH
jgi:hypothetical protein